jgi:hypothetical protein
LPHLKHLLGVQVRTKQKMQERFEKSHQLLGRPIEWQLDEIAEGV